MRQMDQYDTIHIRFRKGLKIKYRVLKTGSMLMAITSAEKEKSPFQARPITFPISNVNSFKGKFPLSGNIKKTKRKLKIVSIAADSKLVKEPNKNTLDAIIPAENPGITCQLDPRL